MFTDAAVNPGLAEASFDQRAAVRSTPATAIMRFMLNSIENASSIEGGGKSAINRV